MKTKRWTSYFKRARGAHVPHHKNTADLATSTMPLPKEIVLPMQQHIGTLCVPVVKKGDHVDVGTLVGHAEAAITADIFSSVSGTVKQIKSIFYSTGLMDQAVVIEPDGEQTLDPRIAPPVVEDHASFVQAVRESGIVGLGGAGFPTTIKIEPPNLDEIHTILINAAECEPYLSTDYREMLEYPHQVIAGIEALQTYLGVQKAILCIENNKPDAIALMEELLADNPSIEVATLPSLYPQGAEKIMVHNVLGIEVPRGARTTSTGVMMFNVTTVSMIAAYLQTGIPLTHRRVTVTGDAVAKPQNVCVPIGTSIRDLIEYVGLAKEPHKLVVGGPMMGAAQIDYDYPIVRQNGGLLVLSEDAVDEPPTTACIRCGRCVNTCPMKLNPIAIKKAYDQENLERQDALMADLCMGCGTCSYVCPAKQPLTQATVLARSAVREYTAQKGA